MNNPYISMLSTMWTHAKGHRGSIILYYTLFILGNGIFMLQPLIFGLLLNSIQAGGEHVFQNILFWLSLYTLIPIIEWVFHGPARFLERHTACAVAESFILHWYTTLMELPLKWHKDHHSGEIVSRLDKASDSLYRFVEGDFLYIETITRLVFSALALIITNWIIGSFATLIGLGICILVWWFDKYLVPKTNELNNKKHKVNALLFDYITNSITVLILRLHDRTKNSIKQRYQPIYKTTKEHAILNESKWFTISMSVTFLTFGALLYYCWNTLAQEETILVGTLVILYQYLERFAHQFFELTWQYGQVLHFKVDLDSLAPYEKDHKRLVAQENEHPTLKHWKTINISHLCFTHEDVETHMHTLKDVSLHFERGKNYALVGESGSGKSSLLTLLRGIQDMDGGLITIDGAEFSTTKILAPLTTLCPQDPEIFENTIEYNITVDIAHKREELKQILDAARFTKVIDRLPQGLQSNIKEKGVNLSGGEKQRLAVARGLFAGKNSSLLLLDEPTSSVDPANEKAIYQNIFTYFENATVVSALHRLHLLPLFDYIYVFDDGYLVEQGSFDELKSNSTHFAKLWSEYQETTA